MKEKYSENIDRLFDPLKDHSFEPDWKQFNEMELRLKKLNFTKFGWRHFNIYYLIGGALNMVIVGVIVYLLMAPNEPVQSAEKTATDTVTTATTTTLSAMDSQRVSEHISTPNTQKKTIEIPITDIKKKKKSADNESLLIEKNTTTVPTNPIPTNKQTEALSTEEKIPVVIVTPEVKKDSVVAPKKPPVVIVKRRDTIVVYDTTKKIRKR